MERAHQLASRLDYGRAMDGQDLNHCLFSDVLLRPTPGHARRTIAQDHRMHAKRSQWSCERFAGHTWKLSWAFARREVKARIGSMQRTLHE